MNHRMLLQLFAAYMPLGGDGKFNIVALSDANFVPRCTVVNFDEYDDNDDFRELATRMASEPETLVENRLNSAS